MMKSFFLSRALPALAACAALATTACDAPNGANVPSEPQLVSLTDATLLVCPTDETLSTVGRVATAGGTVSLGAHSVVVPFKAVLGNADIGIEVPASQHMLVELTANGQEHWQFLAPVTVTIDYSRCGVDPLAPALSVWYIDSATGALLENMNGVDDRLLQRITFVTNHFSGYALAN